MNKDVMEKYNLKIPTNYDEMVQCMETVRAADPKITGLEFHCWGFGYQFQSYSTLFGSAGISPTSVVYDYNKNQWVFALTEYNDIYKKTTQAMADAYTKGYLHRDFSTMSGDVWTNIRNNGEWVFNFHYNNITEAAAKNDFKCEFIYIDPPAAAGVKPCVRADYQSDATGWMYVVSNKSKAPELACLLLDLIGSQEMSLTYYWGWEGDTFQTDASGKRTFTDAYLAMTADDVNKKYGIGEKTPYTFMSCMSNYYAGDAVMALWCGESKRGTQIANGKLKSGEYDFYYGRVSPDFDADANEKITTITTAVNTYVNETLTAFVLGNKPMSEWDSFIAGIKDYGDMGYVAGQYIAAAQKPDKQKATEREWLMP